MTRKLHIQLPISCLLWSIILMYHAIRYFFFQ